AGDGGGDAGAGSGGSASGLAGGFGRWGCPADVGRPASPQGVGTSRGCPSRPACAGGFPDPVSIRIVSMKFSLAAGLRGAVPDGAGGGGAELPWCVVCVRWRSVTDKARSEVSRDGG